MLKFVDEPGSSHRARGVPRVRGARLRRPRPRRAGAVAAPARPLDRRARRGPAGAVRALRGVAAGVSGALAAPLRVRRLVAAGLAAVAIWQGRSGSTCSAPARPSRRSVLRRARGRADRRRAGPVRVRRSSSPRSTSPRRGSPSGPGGRSGPRRGSRCGARPLLFLVLAVLATAQRAAGPGPSPPRRCSSSRAAAPRRSVAGTPRSRRSPSSARRSRSASSPARS